MFGKILKELREEEHLSQMKLSILIGIPQATIARYELNKTEPTIRNIILFCKFFNVSADYLLGLSEF